MKFRLGALALLVLVPCLAQAEWVNGEIVKVDPAKKRVLMKHDAIHVAKMEAMTMPFRVDDGAMLAPFKEGDLVKFDVVVRDDELYVMKMQKREAGK